MADLSETESSDDESGKPSEEKRHYAMVVGCAARLSEHFDSVQIICTRRDKSGGTPLTHAGKGNWYAREGSVREWLTVMDQRAREMVKREDNE